MGLIYVAHAVGTDQVKIGYAETDAERRVAAWNAGRPEPCVIVKKMRGSRRDEQRLHSELADYRIDLGGGTEWYRLTPELSERLRLDGATA